VSSEEEERGNENDKPLKQKKRKKKEKKKKKKKHKKRDRSSSTSSGSASDTIYPSDLLKRAQEKERSDMHTDHMKHMHVHSHEKVWALQSLLSVYVCAHHRVSFCTSREKAAPLSSRFCWLDDVRTPTELPFCVDGKPDAANWTYKSLYRGDIARYTTGAG